MNEGVLRTTLEHLQTASIETELEALGVDQRGGDEQYGEYPDSQRLLTKSQVLRHLRANVNCQLYDESGGDAQGTAIYTLSDPRDIRLIRYVGQTSSPRRRFLQHLNSARLWLPADLPWWIKSPKLLPLYSWIRQLYSDGYRLPTMVIGAWVTENYRHAERMRIEECVLQQLPLLNVEASTSMACNSSTRIKVRKRFKNSQ